MDPAALTAGIVAEESARAEAAAAHQPLVLPDDLLPGVGAEPMSLGAAVRHGGALTIVVVGLAQGLHLFDSAAFAVLAPDIQRSIGVSDAVLGAIGGAFGLLYLVGSVPVSSLADRLPRKLVAGAFMAAWAVVVALTSLVQSAFWLFMARIGTGLGQSYALPVNAPLLVDTYPIEARSRVFAASTALETLGNVLGPAFAGAVTAVVAGDEAWRWAFVVIGVLAVPVALATFRIREPRRGRHEMRAVLGHELDEVGELPISLGVAFERLRRVRSFHFFLLGLASLGFALFSVPLFLNLFFDEQLGLDAMERGLLASAMAIPVIAAVAVAGRHSDRLFRRSPAGSVVLMGAMVMSFGVFIVAGLFMPNTVLVATFVAIGLAVARAAFVIAVAAVSPVIPYRLRSRGMAMVGVYLFVFGGFLGAVLTGILSESLGRRGALVVVILPATLVGGALIAYGARFVRGDISLVVAELREEQEEAARVARAGAEVPVLQVRDLDFSYGQVQVLFDVSFEVHRGEALALLGTNGAGKSTLLRVVSGLGVPHRGVVRLNGRTITYAEPEARVGIGIVQLMGGAAVFPTLRVDENLRMAAYRYHGADLERRVAGALDRFPVLAARSGAVAGDLSGGQQQMLALAMALVHEPELLVIDELSLGLAPIVVGELLETIAELKARGQTMVIVEQSLNVAMQVADRALFMEKGSIRFEGPIRELAGRDDLARAVFLGERPA
jgi:ABC-type branched-subunit amino acid transport system ATPase component/sugar phosphate permease